MEMRVCSLCADDSDGLMQSMAKTDPPSSPGLISTIMEGAAQSKEDEEMGPLLASCCWSATVRWILFVFFDEEAVDGPTAGQDGG